MIIRQFPDILWHFEGCPPPSPPWPTHDGGDFTPWTEFCWGGTDGGGLSPGGGGFFGQGSGSRGSPPSTGNPVNNFSFHGYPQKLLSRSLALFGFPWVDHFIYLFIFGGTPCTSGRSVLNPVITLCPLRTSRFEPRYKSKTFSILGSGISFQPCTQASEKHS